MREVQADLKRWQDLGEEIALATLVAVRRSAPRLPGARLAVTRSGKMAGSVSAGCVENDVFRRAMLVLDRGEPVVANYSITDELGLKAGLSCGGSIDVLIEPFVDGEAWQAISAACAAGSPAVLGTAVHPPQLIGRKLTVVDGERIVGSVDPILDPAIIEKARILLQASGTHMLTAGWQKGEAHIFIEAFLPPSRLFIVGATHIGVALCRMAALLGYRVTVIDPRGPYATAERFPDADEILRTWPHEVLRDELTASSYVVTLTHDAKFDVPALAAALRSPCRYVGALGSRKTHQGRRAALREEGFDDTTLDRIHSPIGLDIGARTPEEIAIAILAEMVAVGHVR